MLIQKRLAAALVAGIACLTLTESPASATPADTLHEVNCIGPADGFFHFHQIPGDRCFAYAGDLTLQGPTFFPIDAYDSGNNAGYFVYTARDCNGLCTQPFEKHKYQYFNPGIDILRLHVN